MKYFCIFILTLSILFVQAGCVDKETEKITSSENSALVKIDESITNISESDDIISHDEASKNNEFVIKMQDEIYLQYLPYIISAFPKPKSSVNRYRERNIIHSLTIETSSELKGNMGKGEVFKAILFMAGTDHILVVDTGSDIYSTYVEDALWSGSITLGDIDGDFIDEIWVSMPTGGASGPPAVFTMGYKLESSGLREVFNPLGAYNTGFYCTANRENESFTIYNKITGFTKTVKAYDRIEAYDLFYPTSSSETDISGVEFRSSNFYGNFVHFSFVDIDGDGCDEINVMEYFYFAHHLNMIGETFSIIKYDPDSQGFYVIKSDFFSTLGEDNKGMEKSVERFENWYKDN